MAFASLPSTTLPLPFAAGLNTKGDKRAKNPPMLDICKDVEFEDIGGLRTRYPYALESGPLDIFGGGTIAGADLRRFVENGDELLLFTKDKLYSRNVQLQKWVEKGTHLAIKVGEAAKFISTGDQVDADRAELNGTIIYSWTELVGATTKGYVAAVDKTTGNVLMTPTSLPGSASRLRLTALSTKILLSFYDGVNGLYAYALDPASPATALAGASTTLTNTNFGTYYDITRVIGADQAVFACRRSPTTSYTIGTVTGGLVVATSTKARTCDGPIAVSSSPTGTQVQVARANGTNIQGDLVTTATLADVYTAQAIGTAGATPVNQIAAAHRSVQDSGQYRCYVTWSYSEGVGGFSNAGTKSNWVDTGNSLGTQGDFVDHTGVASRAFDHDGRVFTWLVFAEVSQTTTNGGADPATTYGALQNTYFLYRDDGLPCGKAAVNVAGGFVAATGSLPGVAQVATNTYAWCGTERRIVVAGAASAYSDRGPREITSEFDTNEARRTARLGNTLYITGAEIMQYDGVRLVELGFHVYPWQLDLTEFPGSVPPGTHAYKMSWRYDNAQGERERSTTATEGTITRTLATLIRMQPFCQLNVTHKSTPAVAAEMWRTKTDPPPEDAPFFLVTNPDPTQTSGTNYYFANDVTAMGFSGNNDVLEDAEIATKESHYENGAVLENLAPPPATIILATDTRLVLAGVSGDDRVWYSKQRNDGELAAFHDALVVPVPPEGGRITALARMQETLVVFRETAVYALPGDGLDNTGGGQQLGPARKVPGGVGAVNHECVAEIPDGLLFKSSKGWCLLTRGWTIDDKIGLPVAAYNDETPLAVHVMKSQHQVRILTASRMLVFDYLVNQWGEWTIADGLDATLWNGTHYYLSSSGPKAQQTTYDGVDYGYDVETVWIKINELQGRGIVRAIEVLGEVRAASSIRYRIARNYQSDGAGGWSYYDDTTWPVTPTVVGGPLQLKIAPSIKRPIQAIKLRLTALAPGGGTPSGDTTRLTGLALDVAIEQGLYSGLPAAQKT